MFDLKGKTALVTGASGGLGGAIAKDLHQQGAIVALSGTRLEPLNVLHQELGERSVVVQGNLAETADVEKLFTDAEAALGGQIDILVNNAGLTKDGLAIRMKNEDFQAVINVNLVAAFTLCRVALKGMMKRRNGRIINISSIVGVTGNPGQANYAASKAGLIGMSKSLAQEVASRGVTVNCIAPGFIATPMTDALNEEQKAKLTSNIPAARMGTSNDIASGVLYLASDEAAYVTGQTLHINGGLAMI